MLIEPFEHFCAVSDVFLPKFHRNLHKSNHKIHHDRSTVDWNSHNTRRDHSENVGVSTEWHVWFWIGFSVCIGIFVGSEVWLGVRKVARSLMRNSYCHSNQSCKTFQYHRGTARNRNIGTWGRVKQPHPAYRNLRFSDLASAGHAGN